MPDSSEILSVIRRYEQAANTGDVALYREVLALDDSRFCEIEDHIPTPFGASTVNEVLSWIGAHPEFKYTTRYFDIDVHFLDSSSAYAVGMNEWESPQEKGRGRFTFIFVHRPDGWKLLHGHWSTIRL